MRPAVAPSVWNLSDFNKCVVYMRAVFLLSSEVAVIGGGSSGLFTALDLSLRGYTVSLFDRNMIGSGTSGRFHGLLHSGARYAVTDPQAAAECQRESAILARIAPHAVEKTGGLFVSLSRTDSEYGERLRKSLSSLGMRFGTLDGNATLSIEPNLSRNVIESVEVDDGVLRAQPFLYSVAISCILNGVSIHPFSELKDARRERGRVEELTFINTLTAQRMSFRPWAVVNAAGPWVAQVSKKFGIRMSILPAAGIMAVVPRRLSFRVINRMRQPSDGDIVLPYGGSSIAGTTASVLRSPDRFSIRRDDLQLLLEETSEMLPSIRELGFTRSYASVRPLIGTGNNSARAGRLSTRDFHVSGPDESGLSNYACVAGGKMTTSRLAGERAADAVDSMSGTRHRSLTAGRKLFSPSGTAGTKLLSSDIPGHDALSSVLSMASGGTDAETAVNYLMLSYILRKSGARK